MPKRATCLGFLALLLGAPLQAEDLKFVDLFNGKDLAGWVPVNVAPRTFTVKDGVIHSTGVPTGIMRTKRQYENFVVELEWMHEKPGGNAGLFVWGAPMTAQGTPFSRGIEVQILDDAYVTGEALAKHWYTGHGDIFSIHGASMKPDRPHPEGWERCLPSENRAKPAGQWNHYRVEARDGVVKLAVNGKVVSGGVECRPRKGYLCLESEGSPAQFKNIRIAELPSSHPKPEECAPLAEPFALLYTGVDLSNFADDPGHKGHWVASDWTLHYDGKGETKGNGEAGRSEAGRSAAKDKTLWTEKAFGDVVLILDWRYTPEPKLEATTPAGPAGAGAGLKLRGSDEVLVPFGPPPAGDGAGKWNRVTVTLVGDVLTVDVNGKTVVDHEKRKSLKTRGPIGLAGADAPLDFASIFVKEKSAEATDSGKPRP